MLPLEVRTARRLCGMLLYSLYVIMSQIRPCSCYCGLQLLDPSDSVSVSLKCVYEL